jgi:hypothetical protein
VVAGVCVGEGAAVCVCLFSERRCVVMAWSVEGQCAAVCTQRAMCMENAQLCVWRASRVHSCTLRFFEALDLCPLVEAFWLLGMIC